MSIRIKLAAHMSTHMSILTYSWPYSCQCTSRQNLYVEHTVASSVPPHTCPHTCLQTYVYTRMSAYMFTYVSTHVHTSFSYIHARAPVYAHVFTRINTDRCLHKCLCTCVRACPCTILCTCLYTGMSNTQWPRPHLRASQRRPTSLPAPSTRCHNCIDHNYIKHRSVGQPHCPLRARGATTVSTITI